MRPLCLSLLVVLLCGQAVSAQERASVGGVLPSEPQPSSTVQQGSEPTGELTGVVLDRDGALIAGAHVVWTGAGAIRNTVSGSDGRFLLSGLLAGSFTLTISAAGEVTTTRGGTLHAAESLELQVITLQPAGEHADVEVKATREELAEAELAAEETQRVLGFIPNFYVSYDWQAAPLSTRQKYRLAWKTLIDPVTLVLHGVSAGFEQAEDTFPGYGQGAAGYARRFGANYGDTVTGTLLGGAILPQIFHQDPRYFYKGTGSFKRRLGYALATTVMCRGDNGHWQPCYSAVLGDIGSGAVSNAYYPASDRHGAALTFENGLLSVGLDGIGNIIQEFVIRHLTPHPPTYASTTPTP